MRESAAIRERLRELYLEVKYLNDKHIRVLRFNQNKGRLIPPYTILKKPSQKL